MKDKVTLVGMTRDELEAFAASLGQKKYRGRQLYKWIYKKFARSFDEMTDLSQGLREELKSAARIGHLACLDKSGSEAVGSQKFLFELQDGECVESVLIVDEDRRTICVSSQVGCALNCRFCATATLGFHRNLTAGEIVDQLLYIVAETGIPVSNLVFMGMGEPFNNYEAVIKAAQIMSDDNGLSIGARRIVISTAGVVNKIYRYSDEGHKFRLAVSLNSPFQEERQTMMPIAKRWKMDELLDAVRHYGKTSKKVLTFEYVLFAGINDSQEHARALKKIVQSVPCKLNLLPYNTVASHYERPSPDKVEQFTQWLLPLKAGLSVRWSKGEDINAACGQLAGKHRGGEESEA